MLQIKYIAFKYMIDVTQSDNYYIAKATSAGFTTGPVPGPRTQDPAGPKIMRERKKKKKKKREQRKKKKN